MPNALLSGMYERYAAKDRHKIILFFKLILAKVWFPVNLWFDAIQ